MQPAGAAVAELSGRTAGALRGLADTLSAGWTRQDADRWLEEARALGALVAQADRTLGQAEESARAEPPRRAGPGGAATVAQRAHGAGAHLCVPAEPVPGHAGPRLLRGGGRTGRGVRRAARLALADALRAAADAVEQVVGVTAQSQAPELARTQVLDHLGELERRRDRLSVLLRVDPGVDEGAWQQHGALLAALDRIRVEVEAAVRVGDAPWRPPPVTERQRRAMRRALEGRRRRHEEPRGRGRQ